MSLHSVSLLYPEHPSKSDKDILKRYMEAFRDTLTCIHCYNHFKIIFENYTRSHPEWLNSKFDFFLFIVRAHNTVNRRLNKPNPDSVQACIDKFRSNTVITSASTYRNKYLDYLMLTWGREMSGDSLMKLGSVRELRRINDEYWNLKEEGGTSSFRMDANVFEFVDESPSTRKIMTAGGLAEISSHGLQIGLRGGRFQLRR